MTRDRVIVTDEPLPDFASSYVQPQNGGGELESIYDELGIISDFALHGSWYVTEYYDSGFNDHVNERLNVLAALRPNWDSYGAPSINRRIIKAARTLIDRLPEHIAPRPTVVPMSSGRLQFEWDVGSRAVELEIESSGIIHFLKWDPIRHVEDEGVYPVADIDKTVSLLQWVRAEFTYA